MSFTELTRPLVAYSFFANWDFHGNGITERLYQAIPTFVHPKMLPAFLISAADLTIPSDKLVTPNRRPTPLKAEAVPPSNPVAARMWRVWYDFMTTAETSRLPAGQRPGTKLGYVWEVWTDGPLEVAFRMHDHAGKVVGLYDISRRPAAELTDALAAGDLLTQTLEEF